MGLETAPQQSLGRIDPSSIVSKADTSVVSPSAVSALTDAFRQGFITADDVVQRVGETASKKKKLELQLLNEQSSPEAQAMRHAERGAVTGKAQLESAVTGTQIPQVPQQGAIAQTALDEAQARQKYGTGIDDFRNLAPLVPGYSKPPTKPDGSLDFDIMGSEGNYLKAIYNQKLMAQQRLVAAEHLETSGPGGVKGRTDLNAFKEDVSPGSAAFSRYSEAAQKPLHFGSWQPAGQAVTTPVSQATAAPAPTQTLYGADAQAAANAAESAANGGVQVTPTVQQPVAKPVVGASMMNNTPGRPQPGSYVPGMGTITGTGDTVKGAADARDQFAKDETYKQWSASKQYANELKSVKAELDQIPFDKQRNLGANLNVKDVVIASSFIKLFDPSAVIREFKWDKLANSGTIPEQIKNAVTTALHGGAFTPEVRQEVIKYGLNAFDSKQQAIVPLLNQAKQIAEDNGYPINHVLTSEEQQVLNSSSAPTVTPNGVTPPTVTLSTGRKVVRGADGRAYIAP